MKVEDYEYMNNDDLESDEEITDDRKEELVRKTKDYVIKGSIALYRILGICENDKEYDFIYNWLDKNEVRIRGINGTLSGELEKYDYIKRLGKIKLPSPLEKEEQYNLFYKLKEMRENKIDTDSKEYQDIRQKLIIYNARLALWTVCVKYRKVLENFGFEEEDLKQMAFENLIKSIDKYDISSGYEFSTYAVPMIYYGVRNNWRDEQMNNVEKKREEQELLEEFESKMLKEENRKPTDEEIKNFLGIGNRELENLKKYINYHKSESFESLIKQDEEAIIDELLDDERLEEENRKAILNGIYVDENEPDIHEDPRKTDTAAIINLYKKDLQRLLSVLTEREKKVIELRFGLEDGRARTPEEVAKFFNKTTTRERILQLEAKALRKMRQPRGTMDFYEEWNIYSSLLETKKDNSQIVDGINIESFDFSSNSTEIDKKEKAEQLNNEEIEESEQTKGEDIEQYEESSSKTKEVENKSKKYLDKVSTLLSELDELDYMLKQTSVKIKNERIKKQKNKELQAKMTNVKGLIQE